MDRAHDELKDLLAPYVLGAVPLEEEQEVRAHLLTCDECLEETESYAAVTSSLALAVPPADLPAGFADRVGAAIAEAAPAAAAPGARRWWQVVLVPGMAVLLLVTAVLSFALFDTRRDLSTTQALIDALPNEDRGFELQGAGQVAAKLLPSDGGALLWVAGLDPPPEGKDYQLWLMEGRCAAGQAGPCEVTSAGLIPVSGDGTGILRTGASLEDYDAAAVTIEPDGGSDQPTSEPIMTSFG
ncbi:MAG: anti-sigma factor domain-containing protein [Actinomycetota bacterium]